MTAVKIVIQSVRIFSCGGKVIQTHSPFSKACVEVSSSFCYDVCWANTKEMEISSFLKIPV